MSDGIDEAFARIKELDDKYAWAKRVDPEPEPGVVQVVMVDTLFESFQTWLLMWGMQAQRSQFDPDDVPTYTVGFRQ